MNKLLLIALFATLMMAATARKVPQKHSDFFNTPNDQFILGYYLDWGNGPFDPIVESAGMSRVADLDLLLFSFITTTYDVNIVWGGKGYANGDLVEGYFAHNNCTMYSPNEFQGSFCKLWSQSGVCDASGVQCPIQDPKGKWCASERFNPIAAQSANKNQPFGVSVGGWSDTIDTAYTMEQATTIANNIVSFINGINNACGGKTVIQSIDFDWEHLSNTDSTGTRAEKISSYAKVITTIRQQMPDIIISYTTRFNAFSDYYQDGKAFPSNQEGVTVAAAFTALNANIAEVFSYVNIMAYDTPPSVISKDGWTVEAYATILKTFDNRYGGLFAPSQIVMGIETGQQAAGGIYPGYERTLCLVNYIKENNYKGISIWSPNQFTYRYMDQDNQAACNFTGTDNFNETAWNMGYPSGSDPHNPNCRAFPINKTSPQFNPSMADCIENVGPYMAAQARAVFEGTFVVPTSFCSAPGWNPCGMCPEGTVLQAETCVCPNPDQKLIDGKCVIQCPKGQLPSQNGTVCVCPAGQKLVDGSCVSVCPPAQTFLDGKCVCPTGYKVDGDKCTIVCPAGQIVSSTNTCVCPTGEKLVDGSCVSVCPPAQTFKDGKCVCPTGFTVTGSTCTIICPPNEKPSPSGQSCISNCTETFILVDGKCVCPTGQVETAGKCGKPTPPPVNCPKMTIVAPATGCPAGKALSQYPGCCCDSTSYPDKAGDACFALKPTCNCTEWMITAQGKFYGIPLKWCYEDCYAPDAFPIGLHIACSPFLYETLANGTTILTNKPNVDQQFCGCTDQPTSSGTGKCTKPPAPPSMFFRKQK